MVVDGGNVPSLDRTWGQQAAARTTGIREVLSARM